MGAWDRKKHFTRGNPLVFDGCLSCNPKLPFSSGTGKSDYPLLSNTIIIFIAAMLARLASSGSLTLPQTW